MANRGALHQTQLYLHQILYSISLAPKLDDSPPHVAESKNPKVGPGGGGGGLLVTVHIVFCLCLSAGFEYPCRNESCRE